MTNGRPPLRGRDVAGAGALMLSVNLLCAGAGAGLGVVAGSLPAGLLAGFFIGFVLAIVVVTKRFRDL